MLARPNVVLILVDDRGFSDLGIMGYEICTPNIDALARGGMLLTLDVQLRSLLPDTSRSPHRPLPTQGRHRPHGYCLS